jgi:hypothetical protein
MFAVVCINDAAVNIHIYAYIHMYAMTILENKVGIPEVKLLSKQK